MKLPFLAVACSLAIAPLAACSLTQSNDQTSAGSNAITVTSTADTCKISSTKAASGPVTFTVKNGGDQVTEFYLYAADGLRIVGEVENVGPGLSRALVLTAQPGTYVSACKPGMVGKGIRAGFTVTDSGKDTSIKGVDAATMKQALGQYQAYVKDQSSQLLPLTREFVAAYKAGNLTKARELFAGARFHYESIEPVAESFGDLDPLTDLREADLEPGQKWTGWHRLEKDLWPPATGYHALDAAGRTSYANDLLKNITELNIRVQTITYTVDQIANGAKGLLDEVAKSKITGEEDIWSHTDLSDFQANVDGAKVAYEVLKPLLDIKDKALSESLATRFTALQKLLDQYRRGTGFVFYNTVNTAQRKELSVAVNALSDPLSKIAGALTL